MLKFHGASRQKMDDKGRFHLPVRWSEQVTSAGEMVLTAGPKGSLLLLEHADWEAMVARIGLDLFCDSRRRQLRDLFVGHAEKVQADKTNRILIADALRTYAGLKDLNAVYLVGSGDAIAIWAQDKWDQEAAAAQAEAQLFDLNNPGPTDPGNEAQDIGTS